MSANIISKNFIKSRFQRISGFFPHPFFADPHEYWIQTLHTHNLSDISLTVLPAYPPVFHMPADLFFHILKPLIPLRNGLPYCGSEEALKQIIQIFYNTIDSKSKKIEQCLKEQLIKDYTIEVHALKSSALLIGAPGLSEAAKELEMYGNAQNLAALEEKTGPMLAMYRSLKSLLRPYVEDNESSKKEVSSDDWITVLEQMHQCVEQFDMDGVDHAMETMDTFQTPDKLKDLMEQLRVCVADVEMEEIMKLTDTMVNLLQ